MRKVYCQKKDGELITCNTYCAWEGFRLKGYETLFFEGEFSSPQLDAIDLSRNDIVCGYIPIVRKVFDRLGVSQPNLPDIPDDLISFCEREIRYGILKEIHLQDQNIKPVFIKPRNIQKLFPGHLVSSFKDLIKTSSYDMETEILISSPINFISEYRGFVRRNKLIGLRHYKGDFGVIPDIKKINAAIESFKESPIAYSIDFGVTDKGSSALIEINDAFALGNYGLMSLDYAGMIEDRWDEIVKNF
jgi:hypothetical protein